MLRSVKNRRYLELDRQVDDYLAEKSWSDLCELLQTSCFGGNGEKPRDVITSGHLRDALVHICGLDTIRGLDCDMLKAFEGIQANCIGDFRRKVVEPAREMLLTQLEKENSFFIDVDAMAASPYAALVTNLLDSRRREFESLHGRPSLARVLSTYYGFTVLTMAACQHPPEETFRISPIPVGMFAPGTKLEGITAPTYEAFRKSTEILDADVDITREYRTLGSTRHWADKCSEDLANLLQSIVIMAFYRTPIHRRLAMESLGRTGDSRALPYLLARISSSGVEEALHVVRALGAIGHEDALPALESLARGDEFHGVRTPKKIAKVAAAAIGHIDTLGAFDFLTDSLSRKKSWVPKEEAILALGNIRNPAAIPWIERHLTDPKHIVAAVQALLELGKEGRSAILKQQNIATTSLAAQKGFVKILEPMAKYTELHELLRESCVPAVSRLFSELRGIDRRKEGYLYPRKAAAKLLEIESVVRHCCDQDDLGTVSQVSEMVAESIPGFVEVERFAAMLTQMPFITIHPRVMSVIHHLFRNAADVVATLGVIGVFWRMPEVLENAEVVSAVMERVDSVVVWVSEKEGSQFYLWEKLGEVGPFRALWENDAFREAVRSKLKVLLADSTIEAAPSGLRRLLRYPHVVEAVRDLLPPGTAPIE